MGNILGLANNVAVPPPNVFGGPTNQTFVYDDLYRLTHAEGTFQFSPSKSHTYAMDMVYDTIHNIALKNQLHTIIQPSQQAITQKKTSYNFGYAYNPSGANSIRPHAPTHIDLRTYTYDLDGNRYSRDSGTTWHGGVDIGGKIGDNVVAFKSGTVIRAGWENPADHHEGFGQRIVVEHDDNGVKTYSVYGHLDTMKVKLGDVITEGQSIGSLGTTGNAFNVPNPHLHFEVRKDSYPGSGLNNLDPRSQFSAWDKVKSFFRGLFSEGPMFIPDTHINTQTNAQNQNPPQQGSP